MQFLALDDIKVGTNIDLVESCGKGDAKVSDPTVFVVTFEPRYAEWSTHAIHIKPSVGRVCPAVRCCHLIQESSFFFCSSHKATPFFSYTLWLLHDIMISYFCIKCPPIQPTNMI